MIILAGFLSRMRAMITGTIKGVPLTEAPINESSTTATPHLTEERILRQTP
jgi:hypothetical protein